jgi:hypothetical protein
MDKVPITFECNGKKYSGYFSEIHGAGSNVWHLNIDKYYSGSLQLSNDKWVFHAGPKDRELAELADFFGNYLTAWYE